MDDQSLVRALVLGAVLALLPDLAGAMEHWSRPLQDQNGRAISGATVTVYRAGTSTLAALYSDNGVTAKANPFTTPSDGIYDFYAANGIYDLVFEKPQYVFDTGKTRRIALFDPVDGPFIGYMDFPENPIIGQTALILDDATEEGCDSGGGTLVHVCLWDGTQWATLAGSGTAGWPTSSTLKEVTWATSFANALKVLNGSNTGTAIYTDASNGPQMVCVVAGVENDCNYSRRLASGKYWELVNSVGGSMFRVTNDTGAMTNAMIDGSSNTIVLYQKICGGDLAGLNPSDGNAGHIWNKDPLSTAPTLTARSGTNRGTAVLTFPDSDGDYGVQLTCEMPTITGTVDVVIWWDTTGTGNARFQMATKFYADDAADDAAFNTASVVTAAAGTSGRPNRQVLQALTMTGYAANSLGRFRFFRNRTEASDTLNAALNVERVEVWAHVNY